MTILQTQRLVLRPLADTDTGALRELYGDLDVSRNLANTPHPFTHADALAFASKRRPFGANERHGFAMTIRDGGAFIGFIGLEKTPDNEIQFGYSLTKNYWRCGMTSEAAARVLRFGFGDLQIPVIVAGCHADNIGSRSILTQSGFHLVDETTTFCKAIGKEVPSLHFALN